MLLADTAESWLAAHYDDLVGWRRHLHRHPELGRQEFTTTQFIADRLVEAGFNPKILPGGTGLTCDFGPEDAPRIALRADIDALPMAERTGLAFLNTDLDVKQSTLVGDTIYVNCEVIEARLTSKGDRGLVRTRNVVSKAGGGTVLVYQPQRLMRLRFPGQS